MNLMKLAIDELISKPGIKTVKALDIYSDSRLVIIRYFENIMDNKDKNFAGMVKFVLKEIKNHQFCYVDLIRLEKIQHPEWKWEEILENPSVFIYFITFKFVSSF